MLIRSTLLLIMQLVKHVHYVCILTLQNASVKQHELSHGLREELDAFVSVRCACVCRVVGVP